MAKKHPKVQAFHESDSLQFQGKYRDAVIPEMQFTPLIDSILAAHPEPKRTFHWDNPEWQEIYFEVQQLFLKAERDVNGQTELYQGPIMQCRCGPRYNCKTQQAMMSLGLDSSGCISSVSSDVTSR